PIKKEIENRMVPDFLANAPIVHTERNQNPAIQRAAGGSATPAVDVSVDGYGNLDNTAVVGFQVAPPDTNGDVGAEFYIQYINLGWVVLDKSDGSVAAGPFAGNTFWSGFGGVCETNNSGDPIVLYDHIAGRWMFSQFTGSGTPRQCFAVSTTGDPLGPYHRYEYNFAPDFNDYPKIGLWVTEDTPEGGGVTNQNAYTMTTDDFQAQFEHISIITFDRDSMLTGAPAEMIRFTPIPTSGTFFAATPAHIEGDVLPPAGSCPLYVQQWDDEIFDSGGTPDGYQFWQLCSDFDTPGNSVLTPATFISAGVEFDSELCGFASCFQQPGTTNRLDTLGQFTMYRAQVRGFNPSNPTFRMVVNHTADVGSDQGGVHWTQFDIDCISDNSCLTGGGNIGVLQSSTWSPDGDNRGLGSIAQDQSGNIAVGYSTVSTTTSPSLRYAVQLAGDTGMGLNAEETCVAGGGSQTGTTRWHDYSSMSVDPVDGCTFWFTGEYISATTTFAWETRVCSFTIPGCGTGEIFSDGFEGGNANAWDVEFP
ncbi:MAG: hypothetical protein AAGM22_18920, partial [Acidobacteriota bacterium]